MAMTTKSSRRLKACPLGRISALADWHDSARSVWSAPGLPALLNRECAPVLDSAGKPCALHTLRAIRLRVLCQGSFGSREEGVLNQGEMSLEAFMTTACPS